MDGVRIPRFTWALPAGVRRNASHPRNYLKASHRASFREAERITGIPSTNLKASIVLLAAAGFVLAVGLWNGFMRATNGNMCMFDLVLSNCTSLRRHWATLLQLNAQCYCLCETKLTEFGQAHMDSVMTPVYRVRWGPPMPRYEHHNSPWDARHGGVACALRAPVRPLRIDDGSEHGKALLASKRVCITGIPVSGGRSMIIVVTVYGFPSSWQGISAAEHAKQNAELFRHVLAIVPAFGALPVFIVGDFNIAPLECAPLASTLTSGWLHDIGTVFAVAEPEMTYFPSLASDDGASRIDFILGNTIAKAAVTRFEVLRGVAVPGHRPLRVTLDCSAFDCLIRMSRPPAPICLEDVRVSCDEFSTAWACANAAFAEAVAHGDLNRMWMLISACWETLLRASGPHWQRERLDKGRPPTFVSAPLSATVKAYDEQRLVMNLFARQINNVRNRVKDFHQRCCAFHACSTRLLADDPDAVTVRLGPTPASVSDERWAEICRQGRKVLPHLEQSWWSKRAPRITCHVLLSQIDSALDAQLCKDHRGRMRAHKERTFAPWPEDKRPFYKWLAKSPSLPIHAMEGPDGRVLTDLSEVHAALERAWAPIFARWRHGVTKPCWDHFRQKYGHLFPKCPLELAPISADDIAAQVKRWGSQKGGPDNWLPQEWRRLPKEAFRPLAELYSKIEEQRAWPDAAYFARVALLRKGEDKDVSFLFSCATTTEATAARAQRPLTLAVLLYRCWSGIRFHALRAWIERWAHESVHGGRHGRQTRDIIFQLMLRIEQAQHGGGCVAGTSFDAEKFFDKIVWEIVFPLLREIGAPAAFVDTLRNFTENLCRYFSLGPSCGNCWRSTNSVMQGCALSIVLVSLLCTIWALDVVEKVPDAKPTSFVDDRQVSVLSLDKNDAARKAALAFSATKEFDAAAGIDLNEGKSAAWIAPVAHKRCLESALTRRGLQLRVVDQEKALGAQVDYKRRRSSAVMSARARAMDLTLLRVAMAPISHDARAEVVAVAARSKLYCLESGPVTSELASRLRTDIVDVLMPSSSHGRKRCAETVLCVLDRGHNMDATMAWLADTFRWCRRMCLRHDAVRSAFSELWPQVRPRRVQAPGIVTNLRQACRYLEWTWDNARPMVLETCDHLEISLLTICEDELLHHVRESTRRIMWRRPRADRYDMAGIPDCGVDCWLSARLLRSNELSALHKGCLRRILAGAVWSCRRLHVTGCIRSPVCPSCGAPVETMAHIWWECPTWAAHRAKVLSKFAEMGVATWDALPKCTSMCGLFVLSADLTRWRAQLGQTRRPAVDAIRAVRGRCRPGNLGIEVAQDRVTEAARELAPAAARSWRQVRSTMAFRFHDRRVIVWTDGSCFHNGHPHLSYAGLAVVFAPDNPFNISEPLLGQAHSSPRAEVAAILAAITVADFRMEIRTDHQPAVGVFQALVAGRTPRINHNTDLWECISARIRAQPSDHYVIQHVYGHSDDASIASGLISPLDCRMNGLVDEEAKAAARRTAPPADLERAYVRHMELQDELHRMFINIFNARSIQDVEYDPGGPTGDGVSMLPTWRPHVHVTTPSGFVRLALRPAPSEVPAPDAPASSGNLATLTRASLDSEGGELAISVGIVRKPEMSIDFPLAAAPSAVPLDWCWPPEWRIGGRAMPTGHWRWSASLLAAMMVWLEKLRWQFGPVESSHRSVTLAQLVFDFEIATGHMLPAPGEVSSSVSHRSSLCIALRMRTISFCIRALLKYARKPGTDIVFEPEWKEHDYVLVQYGGLPLSSMATRPILVNEEAVRGMVTSWIRATASHVTDARAQANQSARAAPGHRRASSLRPAGGPRAWIPSYPEAPLESKLLYEAVMARRRSLALRGAGVKREAKLLASAREREIKRVEHNYKACPQGRHLIYPVVADSVISCALCSLTASRGEFLRFAAQRCLRVSAPDWRQAFIDMWSQVMPGHRCLVPVRRIYGKRRTAASGLPSAATSMAAVPSASSGGSQSTLARQYRCLICNVICPARGRAMEHVGRYHPTAPPESSIVKCIPLRAGQLNSRGRIITATAHPLSHRKRPASSSAPAPPPKRRRPVPSPAAPSPSAPGSVASPALAAGPSALPPASRPSAPGVVALPTPSSTFAASARAARVREAFRRGPTVPTSSRANRNPKSLSLSTSPSAPDISRTGAPGATLAQGLRLSSSLPPRNAKLPTRDPSVREPD